MIEAMEPETKEIIFWGMSLWFATLAIMAFTAQCIREFMEIMERKKSKNGQTRIQN